MRTVLLIFATLTWFSFACADTPEPLLPNGGFEEGTGDAPAGWTHSGPEVKGTSFRWDTSGGVDDSRCLSIRIDTEPNDSYWSTKLRLKPETAYLFRGKIKAQNVVVEQQGGTVGANLCQVGVWGCSTDPKKSTGTFDWTPFELDIATGETGEIELGCRLGHWYSTSTGEVWFDDLEVVENPAYHRYEGKHVYLLFTDDDTRGISSEHLARWIGHLDQAYEAMADLTGHVPFGGARIGFYPTTWDCGGGLVAGNPIYWQRGSNWVPEALREIDQKDDWSFGPLHEIGHDFDEDGAWNFDGEYWANVKLYYAIETLGGRAGEYVGAGQLAYWKDQFERDWRNDDAAKRTASHDGLEYVTILMRKQIGWEPFRETFRWFLTLPAAEREMTPWARFKLFYDKLSEFSGVNVWAYFSQEDVERLKQEYPDRVEE
jgi:hypothetical protein